MRKLIGNTLLLTLIVVGCSSILYGQKKRKSDPHAPGEDIHKHYTGVIGTRKVVFDVTYGYQGGSNYGGSSFYYVGQPGVYHFMIGEPETFEHTETLTCEVLPESTKPGEDPTHNWSVPMQRMEFNITGNKLTGKWHSADKKEEQPIDLTEDYTNAVPFEMHFYGDSAFTENGKKERFKAQYTLISVAPAATNANAVFVEAEMVKFLCGNKYNEHSLYGYVKADASAFFSAFKKKVGSMPSNIAPGEKNKYLNVYDIPELLPVYNDNNFLVMKRSGYTSAIMKPASEASSYLCLDLLAKKRLQYDDIIVPGNDKIPVIIEKAIRKKYKMALTKKMSSVFKMDNIPVSRNVALTHMGLVFTYSFDELLNDKKQDSADELNIFVPYTDLQSVLQPDFKKRIGM